MKPITIRLIRKNGHTSDIHYLETDQISRFKIPTLSVMAHSILPIKSCDLKLWFTKNVNMMVANCVTIISFLAKYQKATQDGC